MESDPKKYKATLKWWFGLDLDLDLNPWLSQRQETPSKPPIQTANREAGEWLPLFGHQSLVHSISHSLSTSKERKSFCWPGAQSPTSQGHNREKNNSFELLTS